MKEWDVGVGMGSWDRVDAERRIKRMCSDTCGGSGALFVVHICDLSGKLAMSPLLDSFIHKARLGQL